MPVRMWMAVLHSKNGQYDQKITQICAYSNEILARLDLGVIYPYSFRVFSDPTFST